MSEKSISGARGISIPEPSSHGHVGQDEADFVKDLKVLQSMAETLSVTLLTLEQSISPTLPLSYSFEGHYGHEHRVIIYAPQELLLSDELRFVGFVSLRSQTVDPQIVAEIFQTDRQMLLEIAHMPGLLSYSSLERDPGNWYNLVVLRDAGIKTHIKGMETHRYASQELSPAYYEWIRLHNGKMPGGLVRQELRLSSSKYYHFSAHQPRIVREIIYEECTSV